jgi:membrane-bound lytic murein transglycosylase D
LIHFTRNLKTFSVLLALGLAGGAYAAVPAPDAAPSGSGVQSAPSAFDDVDEVPLPDADLWQRIRVGFRMDALDSPLVADQEDWYASRPDYIKRFVERGSLYLHYIVEQVEKRHMPTEIALLPVIESAFTPKAASRAKASGLWQFIPSTGKNFGLKQDWWRDNRNDIVAATDAALNYLERLHQQFGSWELALAAYNCGEGCVSRAIAWNQKRGLATDYLSLTRLPPETRSYVPKLMAVKNIVLSPANYGIDLDSLPDQPYFTTVEAPAKIDVKVAAQLAGMSEEEFVALNPASRKPVAIASSNNTLVLPLDKADAFRENLENYDKPLVSWTTYNAHRGESLDAIARKHGLTVAQLRAVNDTLKLDRRGHLRAAGPVLVPMKRPATRLAAASVHTASTGAPAHARLAEKSAWYEVRPGDTLYSIAQHHDTEVAELQRLNHLAPQAVLRPGAKLRIPQSD